MVGGGIEKGETPEQGIIREVKEETGYNLNKFQLILKRKGSQGENVWVFVAFVDINEERKFVIGPDEGQELGWFTIEEALNLKLTEGTRKMFLEYGDIIKKMMETKSIPSSGVLDTIPKNISETN